MRRHSNIPLLSRGLSLRSSKVFSSCRFNSFRFTVCKSKIWFPPGIPSAKRKGIFRAYFPDNFREDLDNDRPLVRRVQLGAKLSPIPVRNLNRHLHINHEFIGKLYSGLSLRAADSRNHITFNALLSLLGASPEGNVGDTWSNRINGKATSSNKKPGTRLSRKTIHGAAAPQWNAIISLTAK